MRRVRLKELGRRVDYQVRQACRRNCGLCGETARQLGLERETVRAVMAEGEAGR